MTENKNNELDQDFMDSHEYNDEISEFIREILGEDTEVYTEYHYYSDGKHKVMINDEPMQVNAWTTRKDLKEELEDMKTSGAQADMLNTLNTIASYLADEDQHFWENCQCNEEIQDSQIIEKCNCEENEDHIYQDVVKLNQLLSKGEIKVYAINFATSHNMGYVDDWKYFLDGANARKHLDQKLKELKEIFKEEENGAFIEYIDLNGKKTVYNDDGDGNIQSENAW